MPPSGIDILLIVLFISIFVLKNNQTLSRRATLFKKYFPVA